MPPKQDKTSSGKKNWQHLRPQLLCVLLVHRIYAIDLAVIPLLGNVTEIQNFPTSHQDLSMESSSNEGGVDLHTLVDRTRKRSRERG